jgi:2,4-dienoyl-CoA reductase-like NADH-dependent reductase (Old Yellow Enzyme family)
MFKQAKLKNIKLNNRFIRSATWEGLAEKGFVTEKLLSLYSQLAQNNVGLIITGFTAVSKDSHSNHGQMYIYSDEFIPNLKKLTDSVHKTSSKICLQLVHCGGQAVVPKAPSAVSSPFYKDIPDELTLEEIKNIEDDFADAAYRAVKAGFDAVQIHAAHGYLISQFLSPLTNKRQDKYGGSLNNRMRILIEIYKKIREAVGKDFPVLIKINCEDFLPDGLVISETITILKELENIGIDAVEISGGMRGAYKLPIMTGINSIEKEAYWKDYAKKLKEVLNIPVILVGGLRSLRLIEELFYKNYADFFSLSRPLIKEPDLITKWNRGITDKSACISCNKCFVPAYKGEGIKCVM